MNIASFKRMCRLLDYTRRSYISREWALICSGKPAENLSLRHVYYLNLLRFQMPCNLNTIMQVTGLSSSAASTFVEKMVQSNILIRGLNDEDRRNVKILPAPETQEIFHEVDRRLDLLIEQFAADLTEEEINAIDLAGEIINKKLKFIQID